MALAAALVVFGLGVRRPPTGAGVQEAAVPPATPSTTVAEDGGPLPALVWPTPPMVEVLEGEVRAGGHRFAVGSPGDIVVVGDWDCDRQLTPAVLRPGGSVLHVFDGWAEPGEERAARAVGIAPGAVAVEARGCGQATLLREDGSTTVVDTAGGR